MNTSRLGFLLLAFSLAIAALLTATLFICAYVEAWHTPYFEQRFATTIGLAHGQLIYQIEPIAPLFCSIYGPLSYIVYLPAALFPTVQTVFAAGSLESTAFLVLPLVLLGYSFVRKHHLPFRDSAPVLLFALTAIASLRPLSYVAANVSADAPSMSLMGISALVLFSSRDKPRWKTAAISSLALVLSVGCKQNMLLPALVMGLAVVLYFPRRFWWFYLGFSIVFSVLVLGLVTVVYHDLGAIYFNNVLIPSRYPVITANLFPGAYRLFENYAVLALTLTGIGLIGFLTQRSMAWSGRSYLAWTFFAFSIVLAIPSVRIYAASGGDINDFAHTTYFFLLGVVAAALEIRVLTGSDPQAVLALRTVTVIATITLLGSGLPTRYDSEWKKQMLRQPAAFEAYDYTKRNPGHVYFPNNTIGVYMAERKFYHAEWGIMIPAVAGTPPSVAAIFKFIPEKAQYIAIPRDSIPDEKGAITPSVAPHFRTAAVPGLTGFHLYAIERPAESANAN